MNLDPGSPESYPIEIEQVEIARLKDAEELYFKRIPRAESSIPTRETFSNFCHISTGDYYLPVASVVGHKMGYKFDFYHSDRVPQEWQEIYPSAQEFNRKANLTQFEIRNLTGGEYVKSGIYSLLAEVNHSELTEHMMAIIWGAPIEAVMASNPRFDINQVSVAHRSEIEIHEQYEALYAENPELVKGIYLSRILPSMKHLRDGLEMLSRQAEPIEIPADAPQGMAKMLTNMAKEQRERLPFMHQLMDWYNLQLDFVGSLLRNGNKPLTIDEFEPIVEGYLLSILVEHPELAPDSTEKPFPVHEELLKWFQHLEKREQAPNN